MITSPALHGWKGQPVLAGLLKVSLLFKQLPGISLALEHRKPLATIATASEFAGAVAAFAGELEGIASKGRLFFRRAHWANTQKLPFYGALFL
jgi:hypothetical protein